MPRTVLRGAQVLDTLDRTPDLQPRDLVLDGERVEAWLEPGDAVADANTIDLTGAVLMPGLIDAHFHPFLVDIDPSIPRDRHTLAFEFDHARRALDTWLASGVTTVRSAGAHQNLDVELRELQRAGVVRGPRLVASGSLVAMTSGLRAGNEAISVEVTGPDDARRVARLQIKAGVDQVKLYTSSSVGGGGGRMMGPPGWPQLDEDEIRAAVEEADHANVPTLAHATSEVAVMQCLRAGVHCIEHATRLDDACVALLAERDIPIVPTLAIGWSLATFGVERGFGEHIARTAAAKQSIGIASLQRAKAAGVRIAAGTDADNSRCLLREECRLLVEDAGLSPFEALHAATAVNARVLRREGEVGGLRPGYLADLLVLDANPLDDIRHLARVRGVLQGGQVRAWRKEECASA
jgi:imidazolonepropionase-like amidohydrolase